MNMTVDCSGDADRGADDVRLPLAAVRLDADAAAQLVRVLLLARGVRVRAARVQHRRQHGGVFLQDAQDCQSQRHQSGRGYDAWTDLHRQRAHLRLLHWRVGMVVLSRVCVSVNSRGVGKSCVNRTEWRGARSSVRTSAALIFGIRCNLHIAEQNPNISSHDEFIPQKTLTSRTVHEV